MGHAPGNKGTGTVSGKILEKAGARQHPHEAKACYRTGVTWQPDRGAEHLRLDPVPLLDQRLDPTAVLLAVSRVKLGCGGGDRPAEKDGLVRAEGVGEGDFWMDPAEAMILEREGPEEGRANPHWMDRRADVVVESGQGEL
jgi:hypothetical protein